MVGVEPRYYHVTDKNLPTDFYSPIPKKHTISRETWTVLPTSQSAHTGI